MPGRSAIPLLCLALLGLLSSVALAQVPDVDAKIPTIEVPDVKLPTGDGGDENKDEGKKEEENKDNNDSGGSGDSGSDPVGDVKKKVGDAVKTVGDAANSATGGGGTAGGGSSGGSSSSGGGGGGGTGSGAGSGGSGGGTGSGGGSSSGAGDSGSASRSGGGTVASLAKTAAERSRPRALPSRKNPGLRASTVGFKNRKQRGEPHGTTLGFWLFKPALVRFVIRQHAPVCRTVGSFKTRGERGVNLVRFRGRFRGELLPAGTYSIAASAIRDSKRVYLGRVTVVIVPRDQATKNAKPQRSRCKASEDEPAAAQSASGGLVFFTSDAEGGAPAEEVAGATASGSGASGSDPRAPRAEASSAGPLPIPFEAAPPWVRAMLLGVLAVAIGLLVAAAVPERLLQPTAVAAAVAQRRPELAAAGSLLLGIAVVAAVLL